MLQLYIQCSTFCNHMNVCARVCGVCHAYAVTETVTHGATAWKADHDRRVLAFKFSPGFSAYAAGEHTVEYPSWVEEMKPQQRAVMMAPYLADGNLTNDYHPRLRRQPKL